MAKDPLSSRVVVIGGSAGSLEIILKVIKALPHDSGASFIVIVHRKNDKDSILENLLANKTVLTVAEVEDKEMIHPNTIYVAPPDYHLLVENEKTFSLDSSEKVHFSRPSIDVTFESVAEIFKERVIGILLSGSNSDGAAGLNTIKKMGGYTIAQNPQTAEVGYMPAQAIKLGGVDDVLDGQQIPDFLLQKLKTWGS